MGVELCALQLSDFIFVISIPSLLESDNFLHVTQESENILFFVRSFK
jgi:hypothetical protein